MLQVALALISSGTAITTSWIVYRVRLVHTLVNSQHEELIAAYRRLELQLLASERARGIAPTR